MAKTCTEARLEPTLFYLTSGYRLQNIRPGFAKVLVSHGLLEEDHRGPVQAWADWADQLHAQAIELWNKEGESEYYASHNLVPLLFSTTQLPIDVLKAAHKRLFGTTPEEVSATALELVANALFHPENNTSTYRIAEHVVAERERAKKALDDLLAVLED